MAPRFSIEIRCVWNNLDLVRVNYPSENQWAALELGCTEPCKLYRCLGVKVVGKKLKTIHDLQGCIVVEAETQALWLRNQYVISVHPQEVDYQEFPKTVWHVVIRPVPDILWAFTYLWMRDYSRTAFTLGSRFQWLVHGLYWILYWKVGTWTCTLLTVRAGYSLLWKLPYVLLTV